jgi:hypothetical protein
MKWAQKRALLVKERRWAAAYVPTPPALTASQLERGVRYDALFRHSEACWIYRGWWKCTCKPQVRFFDAQRGVGPCSAEEPPALPPDNQS